MSSRALASQLLIALQRSSDARAEAQAIASQLRIAIEGDLDDSRTQWLVVQHARGLYDDIVSSKPPTDRTPAQLVDDASDLIELITLAREQIAA